MKNDAWASSIACVECDRYRLWKRMIWNVIEQTNTDNRKISFTLEFNFHCLEDGVPHVRIGNNNKLLVFHFGFQAQPGNLYPSIGNALPFSTFWGKRGRANEGYRRRIMSNLWCGIQQPVPDSSVPIHVHHSGAWQTENRPPAGSVSCTVPAERFFSFTAPRLSLLAASTMAERWPRPVRGCQPLSGKPTPVFMDTTLSTTMIASWAAASACESMVFVALLYLRFHPPPWRLRCGVVSDVRGTSRFRCHPVILWCNGTKWDSGI